jgi:hypothetical protein
MADRYLGFRVEAQHEPEFGGWTGWAVVVAVFVVAVWQ